MGRGGAQLEHALGMADQLVLLPDPLLLALLGRRLLDLLHAVAQQVELLSGLRAAGLEPRPARLQVAEAPVGTVVGRPFRIHAAEGVEHGELRLRAEEGLVVVRAVQVDQVLAQLAQHGQGDRRVVHEVLPAPGAHDAPCHELPVLARRQPAARQHGIDRRGVAQFEERLGRPGALARADQRRVRPFA